MLRFLTGGESHGPQLTAIVDGFPAGVSISIEQINFQLARRQKGYGRGGRMQIEKDQVEIVSGVRGGVTMGGPITLVIKNRDWANWTEIMDPIAPIKDDLGLRDQHLAFDTTRPRPGHADLAGGIKYNHHDLRNVLERASARETAARTAIGALTMQFLSHFGVELASHVVRIGGITVSEPRDLSDLSAVRELTESSEVRCLDKAAEALMIAEIKDARNSRDSVGGEVEIIVRGLPAGLGSYSQWDERLDAQLAAALMSIPSVKGVSVGLGFPAASFRGSEVHDEIFFEADSRPTRKGFYRRTNNAGGIEGGVTNGEDIVLRVAAKPISTLNRPLKTVDVVTKQAGEAMVERTDHCVVPAIAVIGESMAAFVSARAFLQKFGGDHLDEIKRHFQTFIDSSY
jgi:chorismate synthase